MTDIPDDIPRLHLVPVGRLVRATAGLSDSHMLSHRNNRIRLKWCKRISRRLRPALVQLLGR